MQDRLERPRLVPPPAREQASPAPEPAPLRPLAGGAAAADASSPPTSSRAPVQQARAQRLAPGYRASPTVTGARAAQAVQPAPAGEPEGATARDRAPARSRALAAAGNPPPAAGGGRGPAHAPERRSAAGGYQVMRGAPLGALAVGRGPDPAQAYAPRPTTGTERGGALPAPAATPLGCARADGRCSGKRCSACEARTAGGPAQSVGSCPTCATGAAASAPQTEETQQKVQRKCAACDAGGPPCAACAAGQDQNVQKKEGAAADAAGETHAAARDGVRGAAQPLPHRDRIQAAFGKHDLGDVRAQVGGPAGAANERMGSVGYTVGDRIGFHATPDVRLAAHEAAHVVHQRAGVQLADGVGHPGDGYEEHADAVADAVVRGRSAEALLDGGPGQAGQRAPAAVSPKPAAVQHQLVVSATRIHEPTVTHGVPRSFAGAAGDALGGGGAAKSGGAGWEQNPEGGGSAFEAANAGDTPEHAAPGGGGAAVLRRSAGRRWRWRRRGWRRLPRAERRRRRVRTRARGGGGATCYVAPIEEPPDEDSDEEPKDPPSTDSEEDVNPDNPEPDEPDNCPVEAELLAKVPPLAAAGASAAGGAPAAQEGGGAEQGAGKAGGAKPEHHAGAAGSAIKKVDGAAAAAKAATQAATSPMEASIAATEKQRAAAVRSYAVASSALVTSASQTHLLRRGVTFAPVPHATSDQAARRDDARHRADRFFAEVAGKLDAAIAVAAHQIPERLGTAAEASKAAVVAAIATQKAAISAAVAKARGHAIGAASASAAQVQAQAMACAADIQSHAAAAVDVLTKGHADAMAKIDGIETATLALVNSTYATGRSTIAAAGPTVGAEAVARGEEYAAQYEHCKINREDSFFAGHLTDRRAEAQQKAARETAAGFQKSFIETANKQAIDITKAGRTRDRCAVISVARHARDAMDQQLAGLLAAVQGGRDAAIAGAAGARASLLGSIDSALAGTLAQLDQQEHDQRQSADDTGYMQQLVLEQTAHGAAAGIQQGVSQAVSAAVTSLAAVQPRFAEMNAPDPKVLDASLAKVMASLGAALSGMSAGTASGAARAQAQLVQGGAQGVSSLARVVQGNAEQAASVSKGFGGSMAQLAASASHTFTEMRDGYAKQAQQSATGGVAALARGVAGMQQACDTVISHANTGIADAASGVTKSLRDSKAGLECEIPKQAAAAAAKEQPAWKEVVAVILIIAIIIAVVVITIVTAGSGGILAAVVVGAILGAVSSAAIQIVNNWSTGQKWSKGVVAAAITGAIAGAVGGFAGGLLGPALKGASLVVEVGATVALAAAMNVAQQYITSGFSFKKFSWMSLGETLLIALATLGAVKGYQAVTAPTPVVGGAAAEAAPRALGAGSARARCSGAVRRGARARCGAVRRGARARCGAVRRGARARCGAVRRGARARCGAVRRGACARCGAVRRGACSCCGARTDGGRARGRRGSGSYGDGSSSCGRSRRSARAHRRGAGGDRSPGAARSRAR